MYLTTRFINALDVYKMHRQNLSHSPSLQGINILSPINVSFSRVTKPTLAILGVQGMRSD